MTAKILCGWEKNIYVEASFTIKKHRMKKINSRVLRRVLFFQ